MSDKLGPLPEPDDSDWSSGERICFYTADQMRAYASQEVAKERERCAKLCEDDAFVDQWPGLAEAARRIRGV